MRGIGEGGWEGGFGKGGREETSLNRAKTSSFPRRAAQMMSVCDSHSWIGCQSAFAAVETLKGTLLLCFPISGCQIPSSLIRERKAGFGISGLVQRFVLCASADARGLMKTVISVEQQRFLSVLSALQMPARGKTSCGLTDVALHPLSLFIWIYCSADGEFIL